MEQPEPDSAPTEKPRSRVLSRLAIWGATLLLTAVALVAWDRHDYPVPFAQARDPFADPLVNSSESLLDQVRYELDDFRSTLYHKKIRRKQRQYIKQLIIADSKWACSTLVFFGPEEAAHPFYNVVMYFKSDGSIEYDLDGLKAPISDFLKYDRYQRSARDTLIMMNESTSAEYQILIQMHDLENPVLFLKDGHTYVQLAPIKS